MKGKHIMKIKFNYTLGGYYNNRISAIATAVKLIGWHEMSNGDDRLSYGMTKKGDFIINVVSRRPCSHSINIVFHDEYLEMFHANCYGRILEASPMSTCIEYRLFDGLDDKLTQEWIRKKIKAMMNVYISDEAYGNEIEHESNPIYMELWCGYLNHNIEQIRDADEFITAANMQYGQAFYGFNNMGQLCVFLKHHASFKKYTDIAENDWYNGVVVRFEGDGVVNIYKADQFGMIKDDKYRGCMDSHCTNSHEKCHHLFVEEIKKNCGVFLV